MGYKEILGISERTDKEGEKRSSWTRIGVAFENKDGSFNLLFDYMPARPEIKIQIRDPKPREGRPGGGRPQRQREPGEDDDIPFS